MIPQWLLNILDEDLKAIFLKGGVQTATVGFIQLSEKAGLNLTRGRETALRMYQSTDKMPSIVQNVTPHEVEEGEDALFAIGSLTKGLVALAFLIAAKVKWKRDPRFRNFKEACNLSLTKIYNSFVDAEEDKLPDLPGHPKCDDYLSHFLGLKPCNQRFLGPDGSGLMTLEELRRDIRHIIDEPTGARGGWFRYSNANYAVVSMVILRLWPGNLNSFMKAALLDDLKMTKTSIGAPKRLDSYAFRYTVDSSGRTSRVQVRECAEDGAEASALGGYSTTTDLLAFYDFVLRTYLGEQIIEGVTKEFITGVMSLTTSSESRMKFTAFGQYVSPRSPDLHPMSSPQSLINQTFGFRKKIIPQLFQPKEGTHYHSGYVAGSSSCYAMVPNYRFAVVVLTNTSGSVATPEIIVQYVLGAIFRSCPLRFSTLYENYGEAIKESQRRLRVIEERYEPSPVQAPASLSGDYRGVDCSRRFVLSKNAQTVAFRGQGTLSEECELFWLSPREADIRILPHILPDCYEDDEWHGDWANPKLLVETHAHVVSISIKTAAGCDQFVKS